MKLLLIVVPVVLLLLYVLLSKPKTTKNAYAVDTRSSSLYRSSIKNSYASSEDIFQVLHDAGINSCFLGADLGE